MVKSITIPNSAMGRSAPQQEGEPADLWEARRQPLDGCRPVLPHFVEKEGFVVKGFSKQQIWVLLGAALFQCALIGVLVNSASVLLAQIQGELGLPMTQISAYHTIKSVVGAVGGAFFAAVFFYGFVFAMPNISISRCSVSAYGAEGAKRYMGLHTSINSATSALFSMSVGLLYDASQSFQTVLLLGIAVCCASAMAALYMDFATRRAPAVNG